MYSQYGEDDVFGPMLPTHGRMLEIGAWDPVTFSNSRMLIEHGWEAVLVDMSPGPVRSLVSSYGNNSKVKIIQAAIHPCDSGLFQYRITDDGLSSAHYTTIQKWESSGGYFGYLWVCQIDLKSFLDQVGGKFDFVSVDAEGISVDLAVAYLNLGHRPPVMCVEHDDRIVELMNTAQQYGYSAKWTNGTNVIIAR